MTPRAVELFPGPVAVRQAIFRALVEATLHDVYAYFYGGQGPQIRARLQQALEGVDGPTVVIGHSLGSIIAYDVLRDWGGQSLSIPLLATLGSPLAVTEIQDIVVRPLEVPNQVDLWVNAFDSRDVVALNGTLRPDYPPNEKCLDYSVVNDSENHHGAQEYLRAPVVQQAVHSALTA